MKWPSFESLIVTFVTFLALSPCVIYFMTASDDNGSSGSIIIKNLFYLGMNLTLVSAMLWAIHKKFMEEPPPFVPKFYRKRKQFQQSRQYSSTPSNQGHGAKDKDAKSCDSSTSKRRYFRKNKRFRNSKRVKLSKWVSRKRPCGKRLFVGYLGIIMALCTTATAVPVMVEGLENINGYSNNLQFVTCLELLSFLFIPFLAVAVLYTENRQQQSSSSSSIPPSSSSSSSFDLSCLDRFDHLTQQYYHNGESVNMNYRRRCSKSKTDDRGNHKERIMLGEELPLEYTADGASFTRLPPEMRGITLRQLRGVWEMAEEKCVEENWVDERTGQPVTPETLNLYHIDKYIVKPYTERTRRSFVETLPSTAGSQPPVWFVSHWWGESFRNTLDCIETLAIDFKVNETDEHDRRGGGMTEDTPIWICIFANNQWALDDDMATDPQDSSFTKAMKVACFRTLSILDAQATVFTRIWCVYELFLTLILRKNDPSLAGLWVVYTALRHKGGPYDDEDRVAVGIIPGGATADIFSSETSWRESHFPPDLVSKSRSIDIATAVASEPVDKTRILNSIVESKDLNAPPPTTHANYVSLNDSVKAAFVSSQRALVEAHKAGGEEWKATLEILSKGKMTDTFQLRFDDFSRRLSSLEAHELMSHLPLTCTGLVIGNADEKDGEGAIDGMLEWLAKKEANSLTFLECCYCYVGDLERGRAAGSRLAALLKSNHAQSMEQLDILCTDLMDSGNVSDWKSALEAMPNLKVLDIYGSGVSEEERNILRNATHASDVGIS